VVADCTTAARMLLASIAVLPHKATWQQPRSFGKVNGCLV